MATTTADITMATATTTTTEKPLEQTSPQKDAEPTLAPTPTHEKPNHQEQPPPPVVQPPEAITQPQTAVAQPPPVIAQPSTVSPYNWFEYITGMTEVSLRNLAAEPKPGVEFPIKPSADGGLEIVNSKTNQVFKAGKFELALIGDLKKSLAGGEKKAPCKFVVFSRENRTPIKFVDVAYIQGLPENKKAMFQVASNFNAVEAPSESRGPHVRTFTEDYINDRTQGPAASISAGAAAIARVHAAFYSDKTPLKEWQQTKDNQIKFLGHENIAPYFPVINGYIVLSDTAKPWPKEAEERAALLDVAGVGLHADCQVIFGGTNSSSHFLTVNQPHYIDQVFCAAMNCGQGMSGYNNLRKPDSQDKRDFILKVAYDGTYLCAVRRQTEKLHLTLIGGGVFGNPLPAICSAIYSAHMQYTTDPACKLQEVVLSVFDPNVPYHIEGLAKSLKSQGVPVEWHVIRPDGTWVTRTDI